MGVPTNANVHAAANHYDDLHDNVDDDDHHHYDHGDSHESPVSYGHNYNRTSLTRAESP